MSHFIKQYLEDRAKCSVEANAKRKEEIVMRMKLYDEKKMSEELRLKNATPDDDGWTLVTRIGKKKGAPLTEAEERRVTDKVKKKNKDSNLHFYAHEIREAQKQRFKQEQNEYKSAVNRIQEMRKQRKFKPF